MKTVYIDKDGVVLAVSRSNKKLDDAIKVFPEATKALEKAPDTILPKGNTVADYYHQHDGRGDGTSEEHYRKMTQTTVEDDLLELIISNPDLSLDEAQRAVLRALVGE